MAIVLLLNCFQTAGVDNDMEDTAARLRVVAGVLLAYVRGPETPI